MKASSDYQKLAQLAQKKLADTTGWPADYALYISAIQDSQEKHAHKIIKKYYVREPLYEYTTVGNEGKGNSARVYSQLRYKGQIVGYLYANESRVWLKIDKTCAENNCALIVPPQFSITKEEQIRRVGTVRECDWRSRSAHDFREFFRKFQPDKDGRSEHELESALLTELKKKASSNKSLLGIQPVVFTQNCKSKNGKRFQLPTKFKASRLKNNELELTNGRGGGIDILARRTRTGIGADLVVIELKDTNEHGEHPEQAIKQAIAYSVFLRELLRSDLAHGEDWYHLFGFSGKLPEQLTIKCTIAMPDIPDVECLHGETIQLDRDILELHCICIDKIGHVIACSKRF